MPIQYCEDQALSEGRCKPGQADALPEWLRRTPEPKADPGGCADLHTALAQLLPGRLSWCRSGTCGCAPQRPGQVPGRCRTG